MAKALTAVRRGPIAAGRRATGKNLAEAAFWLTIYAGEAVTVGAQQATEITPPRVDLPGKGADALQWLSARYIGPELLIGVNELADEVNDWANSDGNGANRHETHEEGGHTPSATTRPPWLAPEEPGDAFPPDDDWDTLPSASQAPAQAAALASAGEGQYWTLARQRGRQDRADVAMMAKAAGMTGDWAPALAWLQSLA